MISFGCRRLLAAALLALCAGSSGYAQPASPDVTSPTSQSAPAAPAANAEAGKGLSAETRAARAKLEGYKANLTQTELGLEARRHSDADLQRLRLQIEPTIEGIAAIIAEQTPRLEASRARLGQLGPKPKEGEPQESADAAKDRAEREAAVAELDETQRLGRAILLQAEQLGTQIGDLRRSGFARALFEQSDSILSVELWKDVIYAIPRELRAQATTLSDTLAQIQRNATFGALLLLGLALGCAVALYEGRRILAPRFVKRDPATLDPSRRSRLLAALTALFLGAVPVIVGCWIVWIAFDAADIFPPRLEQVVAALLRAVAFIAFVRALIDAIVAPDHTNWRLLAVSDPPRRAS